MQLQRRTKDGKTRLQHLLAVYKNTGKFPEDLVKPKTPLLVHVWEWWCELNGARAYGTPIAHHHVEAWSRLTHRDPTAFEVKALYFIESIYFEVLVNER